MRVALVASTAVAWGCAQSAGPDRAAASPDAGSRPAQVDASNGPEPVGDDSGCETLNDFCGPDVVGEPRVGCPAAWTEGTCDAVGVDAQCGGYLVLVSSAGFRNACFYDPATGAWIGEVRWGADTGPFCVGFRGVAAASVRTDCDLGARCSATPDGPRECDLSPVLSVDDAGLVNGDCDAGWCCREESDPNVACPPERPHLVECFGDGSREPTSRCIPAVGADAGAAYCCPLRTR